MKMSLECGSCDYSIDLLEKLQGHYMAKHSLSHRDATTMCRSTVGDLKTAEQWYHSFYDLVKSMQRDLRRQFGSGRIRTHFTSKGYLALARKASGLE